MLTDGENQYYNRFTYAFSQGKQLFDRMADNNEGGATALAIIPPLNVAVAVVCLAESYGAWKRAPTILKPVEELDDIQLENQPEVLSK